jgi:spore coat polysaccharide biosynthesis protein SpsF
MKIVTIVQARTGSTRLPNKVLLPLAGKPLISRMLERVSRSKVTGKVIVAVTKEKSDDQLVDICTSEGYTIYRGCTTDLLDRHYQAALKYEG